jgi:hypothetical protein
VLCSANSDGETSRIDGGDDDDAAFVFREINDIDDGNDDNEASAREINCIDDGKAEVATIGDGNV